MLTINEGENRRLRALEKNNTKNNMKSYFAIGVFLLAFLCFYSGYSSDKIKRAHEINRLEMNQGADDYEATIIFNANYQIGDFVEFVGVSPISAGSSGNYEISISYTRMYTASAATYLASVSHANADLWREVGRINSNPYIGSSENHNFTIDCNTQYNGARFRIRAIKNLGEQNQETFIYVKIRSININSSWTPLNVRGNVIKPITFLPMTNDWSLYVGPAYQPIGAHLAIKAISNGNVGIGTENPDSKLVVNGNIHAKEIKVNNDIWPDYVFKSDYKLSDLEEVEQHILKNGHLSGIPSASEVYSNGIDLGEMNGKLLKKIEELTLYLIEQNKKIMQLESDMNRLKSKL